jgi:hypothetical protein
MILQTSGASRRGIAELYLDEAIIASLVPALGPTLMDETNTAVIARLDRATQYSRDASDRIERPWRTGSPGQAGRRQFCCGGRLA